MSADCRTTTLGRHIDRHIGRVSAEISADISVDMSVNMSTDTSRPIYRPSVGRHIDGHIGRESVEMSTDTQPICRPICRPIYRSRGAQNTHDPFTLSYAIKKKNHCLTSELLVKFHAKNRYRTNRESRSDDRNIGFSSEI